MEETNPMQNEEQVNPIKAMLITLWRRRKVFYWLWPITFVVAAALILCVPRYYTCEVLLAPEAQNVGGAGSLQSLASSFGFDMRSMTSQDAVYPQLYPDLLASPDFLITLFDTQVATADGEYEGSYYDYVRKFHKFVFWKRWKYKLRALVTPKEKAPVLKNPSGKKVDIFCLTKRQWDVVELMQQNIACTVDKKTDAITISVTAQDKLVCAIMADSVCAALQNFITDYRTVKNRTDLRYYEDVMNSAYREYQEASKKYIRFVDSHSGTNLEQYRIEAQNLETEMQLKQSAYTSFQKQYLATQARLQENTPVFTVLQSASVPKKAAGPRRVIFVLAMLVLATCIAICVVCRDELSALIFAGNDED